MYRKIYQIKIVSIEKDYKIRRHSPKLINIQLNTETEADLISNGGNSFIFSS